jgi:eukaryotic-like serine/threonine-protein kinase
MLFVFDDFEFHEEKLELRLAGRIVKVDALVLRVLAVLLRNAGQLVTKEQLIEAVWEGRAIADNVITVSMARLRKALQHRRGEKEMIVTTYGRGYRFARPVTSFSALSAAALGEGFRQLAIPPSVGRARVLETLRAALSAAGSGRGSACALLGEPGIGKTHVVEAFRLGLASSPVRVLWGFCREAGDTPPIWPWRGMLRDLMVSRTSPGADTSADPRLRQAHGELAALLDALDASEAPQAEPENIASNVGIEGALRHRLFAAVARFLGIASEPMPVVLAFEDLHCADTTTLALLRHLLDEIALTRVLVVATVRSGEPKSGNASATLREILGHRNCERISLERLSRAEVAHYVGSLLEDADGELGRMVFEKSEGNPFFMAEFVRQLRAGDRAHGDVLSVNDAALELVRQHVARLDDAARGALSIAAVIGRSFELGLVQSVSGQDARSVMESLDTAIAAEVVIPAPDSRTGFAFGHELMRSVLYDALPAAQRRAYHARIAEALELRLEAGESAPPSELAFHFRAALPDTDLHKTVKYCRAAARAAATVFCISDALRYLRHALEALDLMESPSVRLRLHMLYVTALYTRALSSHEFLRASDELIQIASEHGDGQMMVRGALILNPHPGLMLPRPTRELLERGLELVPAHEQGIQAATLAALAVTAPYCFDGERARQLVDDAQRRAESSGSRGAIYVAMVCSLATRGGEPDSQEIVDRLELLGAKNPSHMPVLPVDVAMYRSIHALQQGDLEATRACIDRAEARCRELGHVELTWHARRFRALSSIDSGAMSEGSDLLAALHDEAVQRQVLCSEPFWAFDRAVVLGELSEGQALDDTTRRALAYDPTAPPNLWAMKIRAHSALGAQDEVRLALRAVPASELARLPLDTHFLGTLGHLAHAACRLGALDYCDALYRLLEPHPQKYAGQLSFLCEGAVPSLLGLLACALGRQEQAVAHFERGIAMCERVGLERAANEARVAFARCLRELGRDEESARVLEQASVARRSDRRKGSTRSTREVAASVHPSLARATARFDATPIG